jgi:hypothetical protein
MASNTTVFFLVFFCVVVDSLLLTSTKIKMLLKKIYIKNT